ncbi:MAG: hypothetical protein ACNI3H_00710 [Halarcobacter ebronensis]
MLAKKNNVIWIKSKAKYKQAYKRKWFAHRWEYESQKSITAISTFISIVLPYNIMLLEINKFTDLLIDRIFFINPNYVTKKFKKKTDFNYIYKLCKFFMLLYLIEDNKIKKDNDILEELGFNQNDFLSELIEHQNSLNILDKGFILCNDEIQLVKTNSLVNILKSSVFQKYKDKNITNKLGKLFENYVHSYCYKFVDNYVVMTSPINTDRLNLPTKIPLDIDLTLYDKTRDFYYFIQIKYTIINKPYLKDEIQKIGKRSELEKGISQLRNFPELLANNSFNEMLSENKIIIKDNNYGLIIIHTIPQYDFQKVDNIQLYEWNTFRNLLNKGNQNFGNINIYNPTFNNIQNEKTLELECVDNAMNISIKNSPLNLESEWNKFYNEYRSFELNNQSYLSNIK